MNIVSEIENDYKITLDYDQSLLHENSLILDKVPYENIKTVQDNTNNLETISLKLENIFNDLDFIKILKKILII